MSTPYRREGFHSVTPGLSIRGAAAAIEFYKQAFGAQERFRMDMPGGKVAHAELLIGDSVVMLGDEMPDCGFLSPLSIGGCPFTLCIYVPDVDAAFARALAAGGTVLRPLENQFYGDRSGTLTDPFGFRWTLATQVEDVPPAEMEKRAAAWVQQNA